MTNKPKRFLGIAAIKERYGRSHMWIERLLRNDPTFPRPLKTSPGSSRLWDESALEEWERSLATRGP